MNRNIELRVSFLLLIISCFGIELSHSRPVKTLSKGIRNFAARMTPMKYKAKKNLLVDAHCKTLGCSGGGITYQPKASDMSSIYLYRCYKCQKRESTEANEFCSAMNVKDSFTVFRGYLQPEGSVKPQLTSDLHEAKPNTPKPNTPRKSNSEDTSSEGEDEEEEKDMIESDYDESYNTNNEMGDDDDDDIGEFKGVTGAYPLSYDAWRLLSLDGTDTFDSCQPYGNYIPVTAHVFIQPTIMRDFIDMLNSKKLKTPGTAKWSANFGFLHNSLKIDKSGDKRVAWKASTLDRGLEEGQILQMSLNLQLSTDIANLDSDSVNEQLTASTTFNFLCQMKNGCFTNIYATCVKFTCTKSQLAGGKATWMDRQTAVLGRDSSQVMSKMQTVDKSIPLISAQISEATKKSHDDLIRRIEQSRLMRMNKNTAATPIPLNVKAVATVPKRSTFKPAASVASARIQPPSIQGMAQSITQQHVRSRRASSAR